MLVLVRVDTGVVDPVGEDIGVLECGGVDVGVVD